QFLGGRFQVIACFQRTALGKVSFEMGGVNFQSPKPSARTQLYNRPIVAGTSAAFGFPTLTHVQTATGHDEVVPVTKEHVASGKHDAAIFDCDKIDFTANFP